MFFASLTSFLLLTELHCCLLSSTSCLVACRAAELLAMPLPTLMSLLPQKLRWQFCCSILYIQAMQGTSCVSAAVHVV